MEKNKTIKIFIASPMDLVEERSTFRTVIGQINETLGRNLHTEFSVIGWETDVLPNQGIDAQDVVNQQIALDYDIFVCLFKNRIGTPTNRSISGTVEEYERALIYKCAKQNLKIMCYFIESDSVE